MVLENNIFIEQALPNTMLAPLSAADLDTYRSPYPSPATRGPLLQRPRELPIEGEPADVVQRVEAYGAWLASSADVPKLLFITLALDGVGGAIGRSALQLLAPGGRLVMFGTASGAPTAMSAADLYSRGISVATAIATRLLQRPGGLRPLERRALAAAASGDITPLVGHTYALADAAAAHRAIEARATTGKVVLHTSGTAGADPSA